MNASTDENPFVSLLDHALLNMYNVGSHECLHGLERVTRIPFPIKT